MTKNQPQLITYVDRLAHDLPGLKSVLTDQLAGAFGGVHLLPFFDPIDGADAGFDPSDHTTVDPRLGDWADVKGIGQTFPIMADLIVNHVSSASPQFKDWQERGALSPHASMFLTKDRVFAEDTADKDIQRVFRPRTTPLFTNYDVAGQSTEVWTTFTSDQIDLDVTSEAAWDYLISVLDRLAEVGVEVVRLDAVGYSIKKPGTSCFMIPETFAFIERITSEARQRGLDVLVEIRSHHRFQVEVASKVDQVYDFALPMLVLHALHNGDAAPLADWLRIAPRNCVTVLDTHDGLGVVDVAPDGDSPGLLSSQAVDCLVDTIHRASQDRSREATAVVESNLDLYQVNCTYYEALGSNDDAYFIARLVQLLCPGTPQVYYAGLLAAPNDMELLAQTQVGRDINRPYYDSETLAAALERPVVRQLVALLRWRTTNSEVFGGEFELLDSTGTELVLSWTSDDQRLHATIDFAELSFTIDLNGTIIASPEEF